MEKNQGNIRFAAIGDRLDLREDETTVSEISKLKQADVAVSFTNLTRKAPPLPLLPLQPCQDITGLVLSNTLMIEDMDGASPLRKFLLPGDIVKSVNGAVPPTRHQAIQMMTDGKETKVSISRRAFASTVPRERLRGLRLRSPPGHTPMLINCRKEPSDRHISTTFGFRAVSAGNKYYVVEIDPNTVAEKYFSFGDALIDVDSLRLDVSDPGCMKLFNQHYKKNNEVSVVIERAVTDRARKQVADLLKLFCAKRSATEEPMNEDAAVIGREAAYYHKTLWRHFKATSILVAPGSKKRPKKMRKSGDSLDPTEDPSDPSYDTKRITHDTKNEYLQISSDVSPDTELETIGLRYYDDSSDSDKEKKTDNDDEEEEDKEKEKKKEKKDEKKEDKKEEKKKEGTKKKDETEKKGKEKKKKKSKGIFRGFFSNAND